MGDRPEGAVREGRRQRLGALSPEHRPVGEPAAPRPTSAPTLGAVGAALAAATVPVVGLMHVVEPWSRVDPVRRTISEYALGPGGWLFDAVVVGLALASVAVLAGLVTAGVTRARSAPAALIGVWIVGMLLFVALPVGALLLGRRTTRWAAVLSVAALASFVPIVGAIVAQGWTGVPWFRAIPLGLIERTLAAAEVGVVVALGVAVARMRSRRFGSTTPLPPLVRSRP